MKRPGNRQEALGIAVIGTGYWGKNLARNYAQLQALKLICDKNESILEQMKAQYPSIDTEMALNDVLKRDDIHGVVIATPAETHFNIAREVLLAGKHAYVEKPLVLQEGEAYELINLAAEKNLTLMVGHLLQYHPVFERLKKMTQAGELGRINYIYSHRLNLGKIRREENILWSFAPHDISMILSLAGEEPEQVMATGGNYLHRKIADVTTTHLEFSSGLRAHIFVSWLHPFKEQKLVVVGDRKMAVFDDTLPWPDKLLIYPHEIKWENNMPVPAKGEPERIDVDPIEPLKRECEHFLTCISTGQQPLTDGNEGLRVLRILNASQQSLNENGRSIKLRTDAEKANDAVLPAGRLYSAHETAVIDDNVAIGRGTKIWHFSHILSGSVIGEECNIGQNVVIGPDVSIGMGCKIQNNVSIYKGVTLEDRVFCGPSMVFTNVFNPRAHIRRMDELRPTLVKKGASLGANCTIVCGTTIGRYAFIGAGAVVTKNVPDHALVAGNPARFVRWLCECGEKLDKKFVCTSCGMKFKKNKNGLKPV
jgi:UDP-2-acetamido-3-amino-2,3-dideoxy-glucuronate N-acetyltransferase